jgi:hypothetical protein
MRLAAQIRERAEGYGPHLMKGAMRDAISRNQRAASPATPRWQSAAISLIAMESMAISRNQ